MANNLKIYGFYGMCLVDVVVFTCILLPISIVEIGTQKSLGTYYVAKKLGDFTIQLGTNE